MAIEGHSLLLIKLVFEVFWCVGCFTILQNEFRDNAISSPLQEITPTALVQQQGTQAVCTHTTVDIFMRENTHTHTGSQHQCPDHREFVLSWLGRQDESMRGQLTGHAYSSAKEKREKKGARDSKRNELSPRSNMFGYLHYFTDPPKGFQCL